MENKENKVNKPEQDRKDKKPLPRKLLDDGPKFNYFWIYLLIGVSILISFHFSGMQDNPKDISMTGLKEMLQNNDVDKIIIVNEKYAEVYLKESVLTKPEYKDVSRTRFGSANKGPHFELTVPSNDAFDRFFTAFYKDNADAKLQQPDVKYEVRQDWWKDIFPWALPFVLIIFFWIFMLRRAGGGGIGGPGGNIFNIGKSKAILFDRDENDKPHF